MSGISKSVKLSPDNVLRRRFVSFIYDWDNCKRCPLSERRNKVVHVRGRLPATVLFIGEAPGSNEDREGFPFIGKAGKLLDERIIPDVQHLFGRRFQYAIINVVGCAPYHVVQAHDDVAPTIKIITPSPEEILACRDHTSTLISLASPRACVLLGKVAWKAIGSVIIGRDLKPVQTCKVYHPAYLLRQGGDKAHDYNKIVLTINEYLKSTL